MMTMHRKRSDWRTQPKDFNPLTGMSFVSYLVGAFTRGADWTPDRPPNSAIMRIHHQARTSKGQPSGKVGMRSEFLRWVEGKIHDVPGVTHAQVARAVARAKARDPLRTQALDYRQEPSSPNKLTSVAWCAAKHITASTLHRWFVRSVALVVEELEVEIKDRREET